MLNQLMTLTLSLCFISITGQNVANSTYATAQPENWMKYLPDDLLITHVSIPGTHNSCTYRTSNFMSKCQTYTLKEQLHQGVRYLDLRCSYGKNGLQMYHGMDNLGLSLDTCLMWIRDFLKEHPSEFILLRFQREKKKGKETDEQYYAAICAAFKKTGLPMYNNAEISNKTVGNWRGKAIIVEYNVMYKIPQSMDAYQYLTGFSYWGYLSSTRQVETKWLDILEKEVTCADSLKFNRINLTSSGGKKILGITIPNPKSFTRLLIQQKYDDIVELLSTSPHRFIVIVDFEELYTGAPGEFYKQIIEWNY